MRKEEAMLLMKKEEKLTEEKLTEERSKLRQRITRLKQGISDARERLWKARHDVKSPSLWAHLDHGFDFDTQDSLMEGKPVKEIWCDCSPGCVVISLKESRHREGGE